MRAAIDKRRHPSLDSGSLASHTKTQKAVGIDRYGTLWHLESRRAREETPAGDATTSFELVPLHLYSCSTSCTVVHFPGLGVTYTQVETEIMLCWFCRQES